MTQNDPFNPNLHLMQLKSKEGPKDYLPVAWRLVWFREQCPQGTIDTEEVCVNLDQDVEEEAYVWNAEKRKSEKVIKRAKGYARFKAVVTDGKGGRSTGTKSENAASFPDYIEKAETGAIGRALAGLGYGTAFTGDEFEEHHRIVDSPVDRSQGNSGNGANETSNTNLSAIPTVKQRLNAAYDKALALGMIEKGKTSEESGKSFLKWAAGVLGDIQLTNSNQLNVARLDEIEAYLNSQDAA